MKQDVKAERILNVFRRIANALSSSRWIDPVYVVYGAIVWPLAWIVFRVFWRVTSVRKPSLGMGANGMLLLPNHISAADGFMIAFLMWPCPIWFPAKAELYSSWTKAILWGMLTAFHTFPVRRQASDTGAFQTVRKLLLSGRTVLVFPEGTRSKDRRMAEFKPGIGKVIEACNPTIIPIGIMREETRLLGTRWTIRFGDSLTIGRFNAVQQSPEERKNTYRATVAQIEKHVRALLSERTIV